MHKKITFFLIAFFCIAFGYSQTKESYSLPGMIRYFTLDAADVATIQSWSIGTESKSPIKWIDKDPLWDAGSSTYIKSGNVEIDFNGTPTNFTVLLSGTKIVVDRVQLNLPKSSSVKVFEFEKMLNDGGITTSYIKCDNPMPISYGTLAYSISLSEKKMAWSAYIWQCLKGECSANVNIYYDKSKVNELKCY